MMMMMMTTMTVMMEQLIFAEYVELSKVLDICHLYHNSHARG